MFSLDDADKYPRLLRTMALTITAIFLNGCVTGPAGSTRAASTESPILEKFEGMSAEEIAADGDEAWQEGELERAVFIYMQSLSVAENPDVWMKVGRIQQHSGQTVFAWQAFERVIALNPDSAEGYEHLGMLYLKSRQKDKARQHLEKAVKLDEQRWLANNALGVLADTSRNYDRAIGYYEAALKHHPNSTMLLTNMGYSYYLAGQLEESERLFNMAIGIDRDYKPATANLGLVRARRGQYDSAVDILENVMQRPKALNDVGYIAFANGDIEAAERLLGDAVRLSPAYYEIAHENLDRVKAAQVESRPRAEEIETPGNREVADMAGSAPADYRHVSADRLNVRRSDSIDAPIIGFLAAENRVRVLENKGVWTFVKYANQSDGITISGWVMSKFLTTTSATTP